MPHIPARIGPPCLPLAEASIQDVAILLGELAQNGVGIVGAAVVHKDDLEGRSALSEDGDQTVVKRLDALLLVEQRHDNGDIQGSGGA